jgi:hypothetical protein
MSAKTVADINSSAHSAEYAAPKYYLENAYGKNEIDAKLNEIRSHLEENVYLKSDIDLKLTELAMRSQQKENPDQFWHIVLSVILGGGIVGFVSVLQNMARNFREGLFKCLEGYWTVMKFKADAESTGKEETEKISSYHNYYRSLFDLQWSEYQLWRRYSLHQGTYSEWLKQRRNQYLNDSAGFTAKNGSLVNYKSVWDELKKQNYFDANDPFIQHLELVHEGKITEALKQRSVFDALRGRI